HRHHIGGHHSHGRHTGRDSWRFAHFRNSHRFPGMSGSGRPQQSPFGRLDLNHDGKISKDEVMQAFAKVDKNSDGSVTREEFVKAIVDGNRSHAARREGEPGRAGRHGRQGPPSAAAIMERFDKSHKGSLTKADVPEFVWNRISKADANNDGS